MRRKAEREERKENDPWFGKRRKTSFKNKKKENNKYECRKPYQEG